MLIYSRLQICLIFFKQNQISSFWGEIRPVHVLDRFHEIHSRRSGVPAQSFPDPSSCLTAAGMLTSHGETYSRTCPWHARVCSAIIRARSLPVWFWQCQHCQFKGSRSAGTSALEEDPARARHTRGRPLTPSAPLRSARSVLAEGQGLGGLCKIPCRSSGRDRMMLSIWTCSLGRVPGLTGSWSFSAWVWDTRWKSNVYSEKHIYAINVEIISKVVNKTKIIGVKSFLLKKI